MLRGAVVAVCLFLGVAAMVLTREEVQVVYPIDVGDLTIDAPSTVAAGEPIIVEVAGADHGQLVTLTIESGYGPRSFEALSRNSLATFRIPARDEPSAGVGLMVAQSIGRIGTATIEITPGSAVGPIDLYLGPRTVVADADHFAMLVAVPVDEFGNPVAEGTESTTLVTRPTLETEEMPAETKGLLSYVNIFSRTVTGRTRLSVDVEGASGPERSFLEVAGIPERFPLFLIDPLAPADGHALVRIRTSELRDAFSNALPDGTVVFLDASGVTGTRRLRSVTIDAVAEFVLEVPEQEGSVQLIATASGRQSEELTLTFESALTEIPVEASPHPDGSLIQIGPVLTTRESYVPDGTLARIVTEFGETFVPLELGEASAIVADVSGEVEVHILGAVGTTELGRSR